MLAQAYRKPEWAKEMIFYLASQQFEDGHPVHQSWPEDRKPPQDITRSDNHLWMVYLAYAIAAETGDISFLNKDFPNDTPEDFEMNKAKINVFCRTRSKFRKPITEMTLEELKEVKRQFEALARKEDTIKQG